MFVCLVCWFFAFLANQLLNINSFYSTACWSLRVLWPRNEACIFVAALLSSGSLKSISNSSATFLVISCISTSSGASLATSLRVKWPRKVAWIFKAASHSSRIAKIQLSKSESCWSEENYIFTLKFQCTKNVLLKNLLSF